ncbi:MAG: pyridoxal-5-phosphate-dependent protein subunit beta, partial [Clostridiales bacterium]|nr:pyridoxal-5-phosphate-dependent protein subunit beta [Clostridiales bacterium]
DVVASVLTDSAVMYESRVKELEEADGAYTREMAAVDFHTHILGEKTDNMQELTYADRKRVHNLKYYTWVEQQGKTSEELNAQWYDTEHTWDEVKKDADRVDDMIREFNEEVGLIKEL